MNVVALRWDEKNFGGRSRCHSCQKTLRWWELVPILSYFFLRGKCARCQAGISLQYPIIEIWTGFIFLSLYLVVRFTTYYLLLTAVFCIYVVITIYDTKHKIIPDELVYSAILLSLVFNLLNFPTSQLINLAAGPIIFLFFATIWFLSRGRALGFGDAKLGLSIGLLLGAAQGFSAIVMAFWIGAAVSLLYLFIRKSGFIKSEKELTIKSEVPFAPFLIMGAWLSLIFDLDILHVLSFQTFL